jgi:hypothetical protein
VTAVQHRPFLTIPVDQWRTEANCLNMAEVAVAAGPVTLQIRGAAGLKCRATNVVTTEGNIGVFRQWAAFGTSREGYYAHVFLWEAENSFSYLSADETTADFVKGIFEYGKWIGQVSPVVRYRDADYVTFKDGKAGRTCMGFRRVGRPQRGGYDALVGGILCAPPGKPITNAEVSLFIDKAQLRASIR